MRMLQVRVLPGVLRILPETLKFSQNPQLKKQLMETGNRTLVEASGYDKIWGIGLWDDDPRCLNPATWQGTNWLGEVLTKLRDQWKS